MRQGCGNKSFKRGSVECLAQSALAVHVSGIWICNTQQKKFNKSQGGATLEVRYGSFRSALKAAYPHLEFET